MNIISPKDIKKSDFKKAFRGYDPIEVDAFLETLSLRFERLLDENLNLSEKAKTLQSDIEIYKENESTLQKAIVKTQELAEEVLGNAKKKAENIVRDSELNAQKIIMNVDKDIMTKRQEFEELKFKNDKLVEDVKLFFLEKLNEMEEYIRSRNIYKMEIAKVEESDEHDFEEVEQKIKMKKISINTANTNFSE